MKAKPCAKTWACRARPIASFPAEGRSLGLDPGGLSLPSHLGDKEPRVPAGHGRTKTKGEETMAEVSRAATRGVDLAAASIIIETALRVARERKLRPMTVAVLDAGGDLIAFKREDGTGIRRYDIVIGKAYGALVMNRSSRDIGKIADRAPTF